MNQENIKIEYLNKRNRLFRLDVYPFILLYSLVIILGIYYFTEEIFSKLFFLVLFFIHAFIFLLGHWSVRLKRTIAYSTIKTSKKSVAQSSHVMVTQKKKHYNNIFEICELFEGYIEETQISYFFFHFHNKKFVYDENKGVFYQLRPPTNNNVDYYYSLDGSKSDTANYYDDNILKIPIKDFGILLRDQIMEPFSFFQFFSVSLWMMDENRIYSVITLFMLLITSVTMVIQRLRTLIMLKQMKLKSSYVYTYRNDKWIKISSEELKPGDICIIQAGNQTKVYDGNKLTGKDMKNLTEDQLRKNLILDEQMALKREIPILKYLPQKFFQTEQLNIDSYKQVQCDLILLTGSCIVNESMLTGESIPQIKDSLDCIQERLKQSRENQFDEDLENKKVDINQLDTKYIHKKSTLFCGTEIVQTFNSTQLPSFIKQTPPVKDYCLGYVLRTGFDTAKGKLIRTVLFNNENISIKQKDAFILIILLLVFSIITSANILIQGLADPTRDKNKLFLRCILIITTVVPPELPMILTIAVNSSLMYLQRKKIFCTEPYRIPILGQISTLAFDKTGTLTTDELLFKGIITDLQKHEQFIDYQTAISTETNAISVLAGCHSLVHIDNQIQGDPIETLFFEKTDFNYSSTYKTASSKDKSKQLEILQLFPFQSDLKRMCSIVKWEIDRKVDYRVLCKGAPEIIEGLLESIPKNYKESYEYYMKNGYRVLALAYKSIPDGSTQNFRSWKRADAEKNLQFIGFYICESPLKFNTATSIKRLQGANYDIIMITGDNVLTAMHIGKKLNLHHEKPFITSSYNKANDEFCWHTIDEKKVALDIKNINEIKEISQTYTLCLDGETLKTLSNKMDEKVLNQVVLNSIIFSRTSPAQKALIVSIYKKHGYPILMCGDGTNDVGGLKKSSVGIALVGIKNEEEVRNKEKEKKQKAIDERKQLQEEMRRDPWGAMKKQQEMQKKKMQEAQNQLGDIFGQSDYKYGDACIAAPFTSKNPNSIRCVEIILRQGVCTLVTSIQTYKILTLSSFISAYSLSSLHMESLKFSETQSTILGIFASVSYYYFSNSKPLKKLPSIRPTKSLFTKYPLLSLLGQIALHLGALHYCVQHIGLKYSPEKDLETKNDETFVPTFLNSTIFLFSLISQTCIFMFNHGGQPFMHSLQENKTYLKLLLAPIAFTFALSTNYFPELSKYFEMQFEDVDPKANIEMSIVFLVVVVINYLWERFIKYLQYGKIYEYI